jgi:alkylation response protein AidB-like acyl-CoA dehydrogenase
MMLGAPGQGWQVAITTLMNERVALGGAGGPSRRGPIDVLLDTWKRRARPTDEPGRARDSVQRDRVTQLWIQARLLDLTSQRARASMRSGTPGPEGSVGKLMMAEVNQRIYEACLDLLGEDGLVYEPGYELRRPVQGSSRDWAEAVKHTFLRSRAFSIEGGTSEIMRNILAERVLGLPGDLRADKGRPWSEIPRS